MGPIESINPKQKFGDADTISSSRSPIGADGGHAPKNFSERGAEAYAQTKDVVSNAYGKTTEALNGAYKQVMVYSRQNPGTTMLAAFGAGAGIGLLIAAGGRRRAHSSYYGASVVNAVSQAMAEFLRRR